MGKMPDRLESADRWRPVPGFTATGPLTDTIHWKMVVHKTQGMSDPFGWYQVSGGVPDLTLQRDGTLDQHYTLNQYSRALRNMWGGVQTNLDGTIQIEIVGMVGRKDTPEQRAKLTVLSQELTELGIPPKWSPNGAPTKQRGRTPRLSNREWDHGSFWCGHVDVPENDHYDPLLTPASLRAIEDGWALAARGELEDMYRDFNTAEGRGNTAVILAELELIRSGHLSAGHVVTGERTLEVELAWAAWELAGNGNGNATAGAKSWAKLIQNLTDGRYADGDG